MFYFETEKVTNLSETETNLDREFLKVQHYNVFSFFARGIIIRNFIPALHIKHIETDRHNV